MRFFCVLCIGAQVTAATTVTTDEEMATAPLDSSSEPAATESQPPPPQVEDRSAILASFFDHQVNCMALKVVSLNCVFSDFCTLSSGRNKQDKSLNHKPFEKSIKEFRYAM